MASRLRKSSQVDRRQERAGQACGYQEAAASEESITTAARF